MFAKFVFCPVKACITLYKFVLRGSEGLVKAITWCYLLHRWFFFLNVVTREFLNIWLKICLSLSNNICTIKKCSSVYYKLNQTFCRSYPFITHLCPSLLLHQIMTTRTASKSLIKNKQKPISIVNNPKLCLFMVFFSNISSWLLFRWVLS